MSVEDQRKEVAWTRDIPFPPLIPSREDQMDRQVALTSISVSRVDFGNADMGIL